MRNLPRFCVPLFFAFAFFLAAVASAEKEAPPAGGEPKDFKLPTIETLELANGLEAKLVPFGRIPKVQVRLVMRTGNIDETEDQAWLADLLGMMMEEGAGDKDSAGLAEAFAALGGQLNVGVGVDNVWLSSDGLAESAPEVIRLLAQVSMNPTLPASELERKKSDLIRRLAVRRTQPSAQAEEKFWSVLYGDHPYGRKSPEADQVREYGVEQLRAFHAANFGAQRAKVYVVGVFDVAEAKAAIESSFGEWAKGAEATVNVPETKEKSERVVHIVDRPGAAQSTVRLGLPVVDPSHPDYVPLQVTNTLLGGSFASRITANLREDKGYTYSPNSSISSRYRSAAWVQRANVTTDVTGPAVREVLFEINRLQEEPPSEEELEGIQNYLSGAFVRTNSNPFGIAFQMYYIDFHGLGADYLTSYVQRVHAVTPEDVQRMAQKYLLDESMSLVIVGDESKISDQMKEFGARGE